MYVILHPHSNTNPSDNYRVVRYFDWADCIDGVKDTMPVAGEFATYPEAEELRNSLCTENEEEK